MKRRLLRRAPAPFASHDLVIVAGNVSGRTTIGCTKPFSRIEAASSSSSTFARSVCSKFLRGLNVLGLTRSIGTMRLSPLAGSALGGPPCTGAFSPMSEASPRPRRFFWTGDGPNAMAPERDFHLDSPGRKNLRHRIQRQQSSRGGFKAAAPRSASRVYPWQP